MNDYTRAVVATVVSGGSLVCSQCDAACSRMYGLTGSDKPLVCGRCYDDNAFEGKPELRAEMERHRDDVIAWMLTGKTPDRPCP